MKAKSKAKPAKSMKTARPAAKPAAKPAARKAPTAPAKAKQDDISSDLRKVALAHALRRIR